jgi:UDPglucose--hexose-1-phosphate uridylyltransferase
MAPGRVRRPGAAAPVEDELAACPFCAGREDRTPPETLRLPADGPWRVRVVPNLYPAVERQEVVVHTPEHVRSIAELADDQLSLVAAAWRLRARTANEHGFAYVHALVNEGRVAGSSLPHTHSQLVWLHEVPPVPAQEHHLAGLLEGTPVLERDGLVLLCPRAGRSPYEMLIAPADPARNAFESPLLAGALQLAAEGVRRLRALEPDAPLNLWLHDGDWWHLELLPRLTVLAGLELGAGIYVNTVPPEEAAERLRRRTSQASWLTPGKA